MRADGGEVCLETERAARVLRRVLDADGITDDIYRDSLAADVKADWILFFRIEPLRDFLEAHGVLDVIVRKPGADALARDLAEDAAGRHADDRSRGPCEAPDGTAEHCTDRRAECAADGIPLAHAVVVLHLRPVIVRLRVLIKRRLPLLLRAAILGELFDVFARLLDAPRSLL